MTQRSKPSLLTSSVVSWDAIILPLQSSRPTRKTPSRNQWCCASRAPTLTSPRQWSQEKRKILTFTTMRISTALLSRSAKSSDTECQSLSVPACRCDHVTTAGIDHNQACCANISLLFKISQDLVIKSAGRKNWKKVRKANKNANEREWEYRCRRYWR